MIIHNFPTRHATVKPGRQKTKTKTPGANSLGRILSFFQFELTIT